MSFVLIVLVPAAGTHDHNKQTNPSQESAGKWQLLAQTRCTGVSSTPF
jgi:hypothetical protein